MARWQTAIPTVIATLLLTACGTVAPPGTRMAVTQTYGYGNVGTNPVNGRPFRRYPWQQPGGPAVPAGNQMPQQIPPASQVPQQYPPAQPQGPAVPPASQMPQRVPPAQPGGVGLDACIQTYMNGVNFIMAPTEQQLAALREMARQHCLSQAGNPGPGIPM